MVQHYFAIERAEGTVVCNCGREFRNRAELGLHVQGVDVPIVAIVR